MKKLLISASFVCFCASVGAAESGFLSKNLELAVEKIELTCKSSGGVAAVKKVDSAVFLECENGKDSFMAVADDATGVWKIEHQDVVISVTPRGQK